MKIMVNIELEDAELAGALAAAFSRQERSLSAFIGGENVLTDIYLKEYGSGRQKDSVYLTDNEAVADWDNHIYYKYGSVRRLAAGIMAAYAEYSGDPVLPLPDGRIEVAGFASSSGGTGCTTVSLGVARELTRFYGRKVLYLPLSPFADVAVHFGNSGEGHGLKKYLYHFLSVEDPRRIAIEDFLVCDDYGILTFRPEQGKNPLSDDLGSDVFREFVAALMKSGRFDVLIFDAGCGAGDIEAAVLGMCDGIGCICGRNDDAFEAWLLDGSRSVCGQLLRIKNRCRDEEEEVTAEENTIEIADDPAGIGEGISLDTDFGLGIRELVHRMPFTFS